MQINVSLTIVNVCITILFSQSLVWLRYVLGMRHAYHCYSMCLCMCLQLQRPLIYLCTAQYGDLDQTIRQYRRSN